MKEQISAYELKHTINEIKKLEEGKIEKIFQAKKDTFLISTHKTGIGKQYLYIKIPETICLSDFKPEFPQTPPAFCAALRRKITNARINKIEQHEFERIIKIQLESKKGKSTLIIELITPGNIILTNEENKIIAILQPKKYHDRKILPNKEYEYPPTKTNPEKISEEEFEKKAKESEKDKIVTFIAIDMGMGGEYSEEIIKRAKTNKETNPEKADLKTIYKAMKELLEEKTTATKDENGNIYPIMLQNKKTNKANKTFNEIIAEKALEKATKQETQEQQTEQKEKATKQEKIIKTQKQQLEGLKKAEKENQEKGEQIYIHYQKIKEIITRIKNNEKITDIEKEELVNQIDMKKNKLTIKINEKKQ